MRFKLGLVAVLVSLPALGSIPTYFDVGSWAVAAQNQPNVSITLDGESIVNGQLVSDIGGSVEGTITTRSGMGTVYGPGNGQMIGSLWADCVGKTGCSSGPYDTTTITFDKPVYGFAGNWNLQGGTGSGLLIYTDATGPQAASPNAHFDGRQDAGVDFNSFWGLVTNAPFQKLTFTTTTGDQNYTLGNIIVALDPPAAVTPEPATLALLGIAGIGLGLARKRTRE